jgi:4-oxalmesaconate hydratase
VIPPAGPQPEPEPGSQPGSEPTTHRPPLVIDAHGHFTTTPPAHQRFRDAQLARLSHLPGDQPRAEPAPPPPVRPAIGDDELRESVQNHQLKVLRERGGDLMLFSPKASGMEHHVADPATARDWARQSNDLVARVTYLFPRHFAGVCQLPQTPGGPPADSVAELRRCVETLGFVGCNLNPDPSGGHWTAPPLTDAYWFPLYEAMVELDVPAMVHVSTSCNPAFHTLGAHYLNADTSVFMQLLQGDLFERFPTLRFVIPHGGGAVPYHWGRYRGLAARTGRPDPGGHLLRNVFFDTCVYHQPGVDLLCRVIGADNVLFASEMLGAVRGADPDTGIAWDDTKHYVDHAALTGAERAKIFEGNARRVYPRLDARLRDAGR